MFDMDPKPSLSETRCQHIEEFRSGSADWEMCGLQLSAGNLNFSMSKIDLGEIEFAWCFHRSRLQVQEAFIGDPDSLVFGFQILGPQLSAYCKELDYSDVLIWPAGSEVSFVCPARSETMVVKVCGSLSQRMGWPEIARATTMLRASRKRLQRLVEFVRATRRIIATESNASFSARRLKETAISLVDEALAINQRSGVTFAATATQQKRANVVAAAQQMFRSHNAPDAKAIDVLAKSLGVSRRTLFRAFCESVGTSPVTYQRMCKLHELRYALIAALPTESSVTNLALDHGFTHLGRLSTEYKRHFGESPSTTLARV